MSANVHAKLNGPVLRALVAVEALVQDCRGTEVS